MTMYVVIQHTSQTSVTASLVGWPNLSASGRNETEALQLLRQSFAENLAMLASSPLKLVSRNHGFKLLACFNMIHFVQN
jgi:hypothetical protein